MKLPSGREAKILRISGKVSDLCFAHVLDAEGNDLGGQDEGYVPGFMPGEHYGDYILLDIEVDTGRIANWKVPGMPEILNLIGSEEEE